jgi:hypothetical protein
MSVPELLIEETSRLKSLMNINEMRLELDEIDFNKTFKDVQKECVTPQALVDFLNQQLNKASSLAQGTPIVPKAFAARLQREKGGVTIGNVIDELTKPPKTIWGQNSKMAKSGKGVAVFMDMGLPAVKSIVYDIENNKFYYVTTCPGSGDCKAICYALNNHFIMYDPAWLAMTRNLNYLLNYPDEFEYMMLLELNSACQKVRDKEIFLRWHDSGDFFAIAYMKIARRITDKLVAKGYNVTSYAYTKVAEAINQLESEHFIITFSDSSNQTEKAKLGDYEGKRSVVVPKSLTIGLFVPAERVNPKTGKISTGGHIERDEEGKWKMIDPTGNALKQVIAKHYGLDTSKLILNRELPNLPENSEKKWYAIVPPGEDDISATRRDVLVSYLLQH